MLLNIAPKLPMRNKAVTKEFYTTILGFKDIGLHDYNDYLLLGKDGIEIHFFIYQDLNTSTNYGQVYIRTLHIKDLYLSLQKNKGIIQKISALETKSWGQIEFSLLDPDNNLLTFGQEASL